MIEFATEAFRTVARSNALPDDYVVTHYLRDRNRRISIARIGGRLHAFDDLCTCSRQACARSGGPLTRTTIMCQYHGSCFDITTGAVIHGPATKALKVYEVKEVGGRVQIRV